MQLDNAFIKKMIRKKYIAIKWAHRELNAVDATKWDNGKEKGAHNDDNNGEKKKLADRRKLSII